MTWLVKCDKCGEVRECCKAVRGYRNRLTFHVKNPKGWIPYTRNEKRKHLCEKCSGKVL